MKVFIGLVLLVACCLSACSQCAHATATVPGQSAVLQAPPAEGYSLTKCGVMNVSNEPDSVVAPLNWRIARVDVTQRVGDAADDMYVVIKSIYHGTHLDSFPVLDGTRVASYSSGATVAWMKGFSNGTVFEQSRESFPVNTDKVYFDTITDADSDAEWSWCAYLVRIMGGSEKRVSDSTTAVEGPGTAAIGQFLER